MSVPRETPAHDAQTLHITQMLAQSRPCRWCGELDLVVGHGQVAARNVVCLQCGARGPSGSTPTDAIRRWNARGAT